MENDPQRFAEAVRRGIDEKIHRRMERQMRRDERRQVRFDARVNRTPMRGAVLGLMIICGGVILLLDNLGILEARDIWSYLPLVLVAFGVVRMIESEGRTAGMMFGGILAGIGALWFVNNMHWLRFDHRLIGPAILIAIGVVFLVQAIERQRYIPPPPPAAGEEPPGRETCGAHPPLFSSPANAASASTLHEITMFGGIKRNITSQEFRGGDALAIFGGIEVDLRRAGLAPGDIVVEANALFGGIEIKVPVTWTVVMRGTGVFGGYEDKTLPPGNSGEAPKHLIVTGFAMFGGVSIQN